MFIVILRYRASMDAIEQAVPAHREWLDAGYRDGVFLLSGPQSPRVGGAILAHGCERAALEARLAEDPFHRQGLAEYQVVEMVARAADQRLAFLVEG